MKVMLQLYFTCFDSKLHSWTPILDLGHGSAPGAPSQLSKPVLLPHDHPHFLENHPFSPPPSRGKKPCSRVSQMLLPAWGMRASPHCPRPHSSTYSSLQCGTRATWGAGEARQSSPTCLQSSWQTAISEGRAVRCKGLCRPHLPPRFKVERRADHASRGQQGTAPQDRWLTLALCRPFQPAHINSPASLPIIPASPPPF